MNGSATIGYIKQKVVFWLITGFSPFDSYNYTEANNSLKGQY